MWQTKYASDDLKSRRAGVDLWSCSEGDFLTGCLVHDIVHLDCSYNLILCRCDGFVTMLKCSGLAVISSYPLLEPKFTKFKSAACPDNLAGINEAPKLRTLV